MPANNRPPVVFLHGLFGRGRNFGFFQRSLSTTWRTLALDLRNHGDSPHGPMDYPTLAADVRETLAAHNALPAIVIGHSMGGKTAMMLALTSPNDVHALMIADIAPGEGGLAHTQDIAEGLIRLPMPATLDLSGADKWLSQVIKDKSVRDLMAQNLELGDHPCWRIGLSEIHDALKAIVDWPAIPEGVRYDGPTLFVAGSESDYIRPVNYPEMRRLFPHYRLDVIEGAGHWLHAQKPRKFLTIIETFINSV
ncbi:pimeloyl-ACP methyl ester carboxylesterase [Acetobacter oeni]|nr:alpha/beta fold hydrolase [Acetobacter oeni]MBB3883430.1 pimeloyl-ACP methyl ester carboxylesterase [Acetobacter oeni]